MLDKITDATWGFVLPIVLNQKKKSVEVPKVSLLRADQRKHHATLRTCPLVSLPTMDPLSSSTSFRVVCISDTHLKHRDLCIPPGDVLIHGGDILLCNRRFSAAKTRELLIDFNDWIGQQPCSHKIVIGGNHDLGLEVLGKVAVQELLTNAIYLEYDAVALEHPRNSSSPPLIVFGAPFSRGRSGNCAFQLPPVVHNGSSSESPFPLDRMPIDFEECFGKKQTMFDMGQGDNKHSNIIAQHPPLSIQQKSGTMFRRCNDRASPSQKTSNNSKKTFAPSASQELDDSMATPTATHKILPSLSAPLSSTPLFDIVITHDAEPPNMKRCGVDCDLATLHVGGHVHSMYGARFKEGQLSVVACSMSGHYDICNPPIVVDVIPAKKTVFELQYWKLF